MKKIEKLKQDLYRESIVGVLYEIEALGDKLNEVIEAVNDLASQKKEE